MNWPEVAKAVLALDTYRRVSPSFTFPELAQRVEEIEKQVPGWYLHYWRARAMYVLIPHAEPEHRGEDDPSNVPEPFGP